MAIHTYDRQASASEMAAEIDRRGAVIEALEAKIEALSARLTPPAEVVRYTLIMELYDEEEGRFSPGLGCHPEGEWVRYEDHAAALATLQTALAETAVKYARVDFALAASEAKRKDAEEQALRIKVALIEADAAVDNSYHLAQAEIQHHDERSDNYYMLIREWRERRRAALDQPKTEDAA